MASLAPKTGKLGRRLAAHLLRRTTYQVTHKRINRFAEFSVSEAVDRLLRGAPKPALPEPIDPRSRRTWINTNRDIETGEYLLRRYVKGWWLHEALRDHSITHKMIFFLHTNFPTNARSSSSREMFDHLSLLKYYSLGSIKKLANKITLDTLMARYLGNHNSHKNNPNENYAREFMEIFTIGKGPQRAPGDYTHYTEEDVQQAARVLTGFPLERERDVNRVDAQTKIPIRSYANPKRHDTGDKTFSHAFQRKVIQGREDEQGMYKELDDFVEMVFEQEATARFICRKLYRFFVRPQITNEIERDIIKPLAQTLQDHDYKLKPALSQLFNSQHFYDEDDGNTTNEIIGGIIKSPLELVLQSLSFFQLEIPDPQSDTEEHYDDFYRRAVQEIMFSRAGFELFEPPSVAGYPAYHQEPGFHRNWFNSTTMVARFKLPEMLLQGKRVLAGGDLGGVELDIVKFLSIRSIFPEPQNAEAVVRTFLHYMLCEEPQSDRFDYFLNEIFLNGLSPKNWEFEWNNYKQSRDDSDVKIPLSNLVTAIMYSPEYQLF